MAEEGGGHILEGGLTFIHKQGGGSTLGKSRMGEVKVATASLKLRIETLAQVGPLKSGDLPSNSHALLSRSFNHLSGLWPCLGETKECGTEGTIRQE